MMSVKHTPCICVNIIIPPPFSSCQLFSQQSLLWYISTCNYGKFALITVPYRHINVDLHCHVIMQQRDTLSNHPPSFTAASQIYPSHTNPAIHWECDSSRRGISLYISVHYGVAPQYDRIPDPAGQGDGSFVWQDTGQGDGSFVLHTSTRT